MIKERDGPEEGNYREWRQDFNTAKFSENGQEKGKKKCCYRSLEKKIVRYFWLILSKLNQLYLYNICLVQSLDLN